MTRPIHLVLPGPLGRNTGGTIYDRRLVLGLREAGRSVQAHELAGRFPLTDERARSAAGEALATMPPDAVLVVDGLALPAFEGLIPATPSAWVALIHHPLALETGLEAADAARLAHLESHLLASAARVVVTSPRTAQDLAAHQVPRSKIGVVVPGTDPAPLARGGSGAGPALLSVGALIPRKGHALLIEALARLRHLDWRLRCVGDLARDPETASAVRATIERSGLESRVELVGECSRSALADHYDRADLFVLASHHEGYGMALSEALARGLPIVSTRAGAIPDTVPDDAGLLVPPGDREALTEALRRAVSEPELRERLAKGARRARERLPRWSDACRRFADELARIETLRA